MKLIYSLGTGADINASALALTVNGTAVTTDVALANCGWETFTEFEIATISLVKGKNTITITFMKKTFFMTNSKICSPKNNSIKWTSLSMP